MTSRPINANDIAGFNVSFGTVTANVQTIYTPSSVSTAPTAGLNFDNQSNPVTVSGAPAELDHIRISQPNGSNNQYTITGSASQVAGLNFQMESLSGSAPSSNMYGVIGASTNDGPGTVAGLYGRAIASAGCTGNAVAIKSGVNTSAAAAACYGLQQAHDTFTNGGVVTASIWTTTNVIGQPVKLNYGLLLDSNVQIQSGGAGFQMFASGAGDFLALKNSTGTANLFEVTSTGATGIGVSNGTFGLGENASIKGYMVVGTPSTGPYGLYGDTGAGAIIMGAASNHAAQIRTNNITALTLDTSQNAFVPGSISAQSGTAIPAGGSAGKGLMVSSTSNFGIFFGSGAPTLSAAQGSLYLRTDGSSASTRLYVNTNGSTGWTNVTTAT